MVVAASSGISAVESTSSRVSTDYVIYDSEMRGAALKKQRSFQLEIKPNLAHETLTLLKSTDAAAIDTEKIYDSL